MPWRWQPEIVSVLFLTELCISVTMTSLVLIIYNDRVHLSSNEVPTDSCKCLPDDHLLSKEKSAHCAILWRLCQLGRLSAVRASVRERWRAKG
jgi:hypothetical protein